MDSEAFTQIAVFASVTLVWRRRRSPHPRSEPLLETPGGRAVTGALAAACHVGVWADVVQGPESAVFAASFVSLYALSSARSSPGCGAVRAVRADG
jgi:hypothetical protein